MKDRSTESMDPLANRAMLGTVAIFVITTVHHVYGAYIYNTPWRIHAAFISGGATALIAWTLWLYRRTSTERAASFAFWSFMSLTFVIPFLSFGLFEGAYNHGLKDVLYFGHASQGLLQRLFPDPMYEMPNDWFFEVTGLMHIVPGFMTGWYVYRLMQMRQRLHKRINQEVTAA